jgi:hypothetical protein
LSQIIPWIFFALLAMIGIVGDSNTGKSTLLNSLIGQKLLPQNYKSCTSAITSATFAKVSAPTLTLTTESGEETVEGRMEIKEKIKVLNEEIRGRGKAERSVATTASLRCTARQELVEAGVCDGTLRFVDMPGQDETDNPVVKDCLVELLSHCHGLFVVVRHDGVKSDRLAVLLDSLTTEAPHIFQDAGAVTFVITQLDTLRDDESEEEGEGKAKRAAEKVANIQKDLKAELKEFLGNRDCMLEFPGFVKDVEVVCVSVDSKLCGGHQYWKLLHRVGDMHREVADLKLRRKVRICDRILFTFRDLLDDCGDRYPARAASVLEVAQTKEKIDSALFVVSAAALMVTIPLGGWGALAGPVAMHAGLGVCTASVGLNAGAKYMADRGLSQKFALFIISSNSGALGAASFGAVGADVANSTVEFAATEKEIKSGAVYWDTLLDARENPIYIGTFKNNKPHGEGRLFWPSTRFEAFIGTFEEGKLKVGNFFSVKGFFVGRMEMTEHGHLQATVEQPDEEAMKASFTQAASRSHTPEHSPRAAAGEDGA